MNSQTEKTKQFCQVAHLRKRQHLAQMPGLSLLVQRDFEIGTQSNSDARTSISTDQDNLMFAPGSFGVRNTLTTADCSISKGCRIRMPQGITNCKRQRKPATISLAMEMRCFQCAVSFADCFVRNEEAKTSQEKKQKSNTLSPCQHRHPQATRCNRRTHASCLDSCKIVFYLRAVKDCYSI